MENILVTIKSHSKLALLVSADVQLYNQIYRRAPIVESPEGKELQKRLFKEVLDDCRKVDPTVPQFSG